MNRQIRALGIVLMLLFVALFVNLNWIQVVRANDYAHDPRNGRIAFTQFSKPRGVIQTADGAVLARSVPVDDPFKLQRQYPEGALFGQITGFFSFTFGNEGIERQYDSELAAHRPPRLRNLGELFGQRDVTNDVTLTMTKKLQQVAQSALGNRKGSVVAIDPTTGAVLALWSFPSYDPNPLSSHDSQTVRTARDALLKDPANPMLPRAYRERYPPGSTFKVVTSSAVLEKSPDLATKVYPTLTALPLPQTKGLKLSNFGGEACGGVLPDLLRVSCNTGFAQIGLDMGADKLISQAEASGFTSRPPLDLPSVASSTIPAASAFKQDLPGLAKTAIGQQDVQATPLEMALVAAGVANGGVIMKPHVMAEIRDNQGNVVQTYNPEPWMRATSPETAAQVRDMMIGVAQRGTATRVQIPGVTVAAKTGTAQTVGNNSHAWLIAFAPAEAPKIAVAVIVESQPGLGDNATGGLIAAPIARQVIQAALAP